MGLRSCKSRRWAAYPNAFADRCIVQLWCYHRLAVRIAATHCLNSGAYWFTSMSLRSDLGSIPRVLNFLINDASAS